MLQHRRGVSLSCAPPMRARHGGPKSAGTKGAQGLRAEESFCKPRLAKPGGRPAVAGRVSGAYLAWTAAGATLPPLRALPGAPTSPAQEGDTTQDHPRLEENPETDTGLQSAGLRCHEQSGGRQPAGSRGFRRSESSVQGRGPARRGGLHTVPPGFAVERRQARASRLSMSGPERCLSRGLWAAIRDALCPVPSGPDLHPFRPATTYPGG